MIISVEKGQYGQWIITAEYGGWFHSKQYYYDTKKEAIARAKLDLENNKFFSNCFV